MDDERRPNDVAGESRGLEGRANPKFGGVARSFFQQSVKDPGGLSLPSLRMYWAVPLARWWSWPMGMVQWLRRLWAFHCIAACRVASWGYRPANAT